jgi:hypothetical protein
MQSEQPVRHGSAEVRPSPSPSPSTRRPSPSSRPPRAPHAGGGTRASWPSDAASGFGNCSSITPNGRRTRKGRSRGAVALRVWSPKPPASPRSARENGEDICRFSAKVYALHTASNGAATLSEGGWKRPFAWPILKRRPGLSASLNCTRPRRHATECVTRAVRSAHGDP